MPVDPEMRMPVEGIQTYPGQPTSTLRKLGVGLGALVLIIAFGTVGFMIIEDMKFLDAVYMTIITLSTVGYGEVVPLHPSGRVLAIVVIIFGVVIGAYVATTVGQLVLEGQFREVFERRKMKKKIAELKDHYILAGFGRVGQQVAREFARRKAPFVVLEKDPAALKKLLEFGYLFLEGEATSDEILSEAGIKKAHTLVSTLPDEAQNVYLTLSARHINQDLNIIARADYEEGERKLMRAGANHVVSPHIIGGQRMAMASLRPHVVDFMHMASLGEGGLSIEEIVIPEGCKFADETVLESGLKDDYGVTVIGIKKQDGPMSIAPGPKAVLQAHDTLVLIGPNEGLERLTTDISKKEKAG
jgi:voltage-gated potassium channel